MFFFLSLSILSLYYVGTRTKWRKSQHRGNYYTGDGKMKGIIDWEYLFNKRVKDDFAETPFVLRPDSIDYEYHYSREVLRRGQ
jgi:hypothetical protein